MTPMQKATAEALEYIFTPKARKAGLRLIGCYWNEEERLIVSFTPIAPDKSFTHVLVFTQEMNLDYMLARIEMLAGVKG